MRFIIFHSKGAFLSFSNVLTADGTVSLRTLSVATEDKQVGTLTMEMDADNYSGEKQRRYSRQPH